MQYPAISTPLISCSVRLRSGQVAARSLHNRCLLSNHGETIIIVEPPRPQELAWLRVSAYGLSERERAVMDLVVRGASTRQISQALYISEYTVQDHLSNVFDKVGVRGRWCFPLPWLALRLVEVLLYLRFLEVVAGDDGEAGFDQFFEGSSWLFR